MKVVVTAIGTNHFFHLAAQLERLEALEAIYTGYPRFKLRNTGVSAARIHTFPWFQTLYMSQSRFGLRSAWFDRQLCHISNRSLDLYVSKVIPRCDVFIGQSNCSLRTGTRVQKRGGVYICDRPCAHIRYQDRLLREEYARQGLPYAGIDPRILDREEREYAMADAILVASSFSRRSFLEMGVPESKLRMVPYGVDTSRFSPTGEEPFDEFTVLFVGNASIQKGVPDLLSAFSMLKSPRKSLVLAGSVHADVRHQIDEAVKSGQVRTLGPQPQCVIKSLMSRSHVLVLPSIQEGFGMVIAEALACGLPVIASTNSGGPDLLEDGKSGFLVAPGAPEQLACKLQSLADDPARQSQMASSALSQAAALNGWATYGAKVLDVCRSLRGASS